MSLTSSGFNCDVCGVYILGLFSKDKVYPVKLKNIDKMVDCCRKCIKIIKTSDGDWKKLPEGRLKKAFQEASKSQEESSFISTQP